MVTVHDVAAYILRKTGPIAAMRLHKLVYYAQAWSLVWDEKPLFGERLEAWANGPVVRELYEAHYGKFSLDNWPSGDQNKLTAEERATIDSVITFYGDKPAQWLSDLTHRELPWLEARRGLPIGYRGDAEITHAAMAEYYGSL